MSTGGSRVASPGQLFQPVASAGVGGRLQLGIVRHNQEQQVTAVPEATAEQMRSSITPLPSPGFPHESLPFPISKPCGISEKAPHCTTYALG